VTPVIINGIRHAAYSLTDVGALESEALYFLGGLCIMFLGAGKYAVSRQP
jgi:putative oxidoreductase